MRPPVKTAYDLNFGEPMKVQAGIRVAFIVSQFPLLSETFILNQISGLIDRGCEVDIYAHKVSNEAVIHSDVVNYRLLSRTKCLSLPRSDSSMARIGKGTHFLIDGLSKHPAATLKALNPLKFGRTALSLTRLHQSHLFRNKQPYDIVHCQFGPNGNLGMQLKEAGALQGKLITHFRGYDSSAYVRFMGRDVYRNLFRKADLILCVSASIKARLLDLGCEEQKILIHHSGVDTDQFAVSHVPSRNGGKVRLVTIGRLVEKKGIKYAIEAVAEALKTHPELEYRIAGDGPLFNDLLRLIADLNVGERIQLLGRKRHDEVVQLLEDADILLAPSVTTENGDEEGIPNVLMEALARGLPVLSTYHGGIAELVQNGKSGFLVPEKDAKALAEKLRVLTDNRDLWPAMGKVGRSHVEEHFNINKLNDKLLAIYLRMCNLKSNPGAQQPA
jgi:colanic acid/amylovoran biosynthesis glycosyltransferase